jgi:hypothetical protein
MQRQSLTREGPRNKNQEAAPEEELEHLRSSGRQRDELIQHTVSRDPTVSLRLSTWKGSGT